MAATLAVTFTLISFVQGSLCIIIKISHFWNPDQSVIGETLNWEREVKNPQDLYAVSLWKYGTTVSHVLRVISCICKLFLILRHGGVFEPTLTAHWYNRNDSHDLPQGGLGLP